jgi:hypothetical protein
MFLPACTLCACFSCPRLQGRISHRNMELGVATLFVVLGVAMLMVAAQRLGV